MKRVITTIILCGAFFFSQAGNGSVFPNPATTEFTVKVEEGKKLKTVDVYNYLGVKVANVSYSYGPEVVANISALKAGKYFVNLTYWDGGREVVQLLKR